MPLQTGLAGRLAAASLFCLSSLSAQTIISGYSGGHAVSKRASDLGPAIPHGPNVLHHPPGPANDPHGPDGATQTTMGPLLNAAGGASFDGMNVGNGGYIPSDNNIAVGPNHVVEVVNAAYAVYSKTGATLLTPRALGTLWQGLQGSTCSNNSGDTVVQYDRLADRWIITQLGSLSSPYSECIAVSTTNDPTTTTYSLYSFDFGVNLNDYPKIGVWPTATNSAYLLTYNLFANGSSFVGPGICAYDRAAMLAGTPSAGWVCATNVNGASFLPIDLDGPTPPPDGTPGYFMSLYGSSLGVYSLSPNFSVSPPTGTLSPFTTISVASYSEASFSPQPGTSETLDSLSDRAMFRLAYRRFSGHDSIVLNHSVVAGSSGNSGVRWYELRSTTPGGPFSLFQQGTYAPDNSYRWMGSAAMDQAGDIAIGYSVSDASVTYPSVRYTGRVPSDAAGTMETEGVIINGSGSQTGYTRWGDYSSMRIDPADDCTFWYVNEYYPATASYYWYTRIGSFRFSNCSSGPDFTVGATPGAQSVAPGTGTSYTVNIGSVAGYTGTVTLSVTGAPAGVTTGFTTNTVTGGSGSSTLSVSTSSSTPGGTYTLNIQATDGTLTHTTTVTLNISDFAISATSASVSVSQGKSASYTATIYALGGFSSTVAMSVSGLPSGATAGFNPTSVNTSGNSTLTVNAATAAAGVYPLTITGTSGAQIHSTGVSLTITASGFTISASPASQSAGPNTNNIKYTVTIGSVGGFNSSVSFGQAGLPAGATAGFSPTSVNGSGNSTFTVNTGTAAPGTYPITITGTSGVLSHSTSVSLTVLPPDFSLTLSSSTPSTKQGQGTTVTVTVGALYGLTGSVALALGGTPPTGLTAVFNPVSITGSGRSTLTLTPNGTPAGSYPLSVTGTSGALTHSANFTLTVSLGGTISLSAKPATLTVSRSTQPSAATVVTVTSASGFAGTVSLTASSLPGGGTAGFNPPAVSVSPGNSGSTTVTLSVSPTTNTGNYNVTITGSSGSGGPSAQTKVTLQVTK